MDQTTMICSRCRVEKPLGEFYRDSTKAQGRSANCKSCDHARREEAARLGALQVSETTSRKCAKCGAVKSVLEFAKNPRSPLGRGYACKLCEYLRLKDKLGSEEYRRYRKAWELQHRYGMSTAEHAKRIQDQMGCCAICGAKTERLVVDHNHATGRVRALLCISCNGLIGLANDDPDILRAAIKYLERFENTDDSHETA